jgi:putative acetyltransferase
MTVAITPYRPELAPAFARLNRMWIERLFRLEDSDLTVLNDPQAQVLDPGGQIFFALNGSEPVGTVAAIRVTATTFELAKMAVAPSHQGRGLGEKLGLAAIAFARGAGASLMFLETNSRLVNAVRLYRRLGFDHAPPPHPSVYERSNVYMELRFAPGTDATTHL